VIKVVPEFQQRARQEDEEKSWDKAACLLTLSLWRRRIVSGWSEGK